MTGGGFGGCVVAIASQVVIPQLMTAVERDYQDQTGCVPRLIPAEASAGAFMDDLDVTASTHKSAGDCDATDMRR